ncbi:MAG: dihydrodipicolinate synthase family protein [Ruminococcaceae bacterium]|nr:dihydrodipicolinate synthase family protein [Oscillospiraceae bacterium]
MKPGFIPALGTPLTADGELCVSSFKTQIEQQIGAGAVGLLCMGSMGQQAFIREDVYRDVAKAAVEAAAGRVPVFVGAMDTSIARAKARMAKMEDLDITAFVFTAPYYSVCNRAQMMSYFRAVAAATKHGFMIYDLPPVTQAKITYDMVLELLETVPNFVGIKSADTQMFRKLKLNPDVPEDFMTVYSGLDTFDVSYGWGINHCLDGMLSCTPYNTKMLFEALNKGDRETAAVHMNNIVAFRDFFVAHNLWPSFSAAMNLLGCEGKFSPDYNPDVTPELLETVRAEMIRIGELKA